MQMRGPVRLRRRLLLAALVCQGCVSPRLSENDRWWLHPPPSATHVAFEQGGKWGYKGPSGAVVIPPRFDYAISFPGKGDIALFGSDQTVHLEAPSAPLGRVQVGNRWGFIDAAGNEVIAPQFERVLDFYENLTAARLGGLWGYIDRSGRMVIAPRFEEASPFLLGVGHVRENGVWKAIDASGEPVAGR